MLNLSLTIGKFHPAIVNAIAGMIPEGSPIKPADLIDYVLSRCQETIAEGHKSSETRFRASEKETKKANSWKVNLTGSVKGITLPDTAVGLLVRLNTYLEGSREYFCRVETVALSASVEKYIGDVHGTLLEAITAAEKAAKASAQAN